MEEGLETKVDQGAKAEQAARVGPAEQEARAGLKTTTERQMGPKAPHGGADGAEDHSSGADGTKDPHSGVDYHQSGLGRTRTENIERLVSALMAAIGQANSSATVSLIVTGQPDSSAMVSLTKTGH